MILIARLSNDGTIVDLRFIPSRRLRPLKKLIFVHQNRRRHRRHLCPRPGHDRTPILFMNFQVGYG